MRKFWFVACVAAFLVLVPSCAGNGAQVERIAALEEKVAQLEERLLNTQTDVLKLGKYKTVILDPTQTGYGRVDSNNGFFLVAVDEVQPYLDGQRVVLKIGNPLNITFNGFEADLKWGREMPSDLSGISGWLSSLHERSFSMLDELKPGAWTRVTFTLPGTTAEEVRHLEVCVDTDKIGLW